MFGCAALDKGGFWRCVKITCSEKEFPPPPKWGLTGVEISFTGIFGEIFVQGWS
jgi:hypothetical protein